MRQSTNWVLASTSLVLGIMVLTGCPSAPTQRGTTPYPSTQPGTTGFQAKDYLYPGSRTYSVTYDVVNTFEWPGASASANATATASITTSVATYSPTVAIVQEHFKGSVITDPRTGSKLDVDSTTLSTVSVQPDGSVVEQAMEGPKRTTPNTAFTASGATVVEATDGSTGTKLALVTTESLTVPAGTFDTLKLQETPVTSDPNIQPDYIWVAKGPGRVKAGYSSTQSVMVSGQVMTATQSQWTTLTHYTP